MPTISITNERKIAQLEVSGENVTLKGELQLDDDNKVISMNLLYRRNAEEDPNKYLGVIGIQVNSYMADDNTFRAEVIGLVASAIHSINTPTSAENESNED